MGPGHEKYLLPIGREALESADVVIGAIRYLSVFGKGSQVLIPLTSPYTDIVKIIEGYKKNKNIAVLVSGDASFYSFTNYIKRHFDKEVLEIIPGVSSIQYMYSRIGLSYENAYFTSFHGRKGYIPRMEKPFNSIAFLTDQHWTPEKIAQYALQAQHVYQWMYIGENLSYEHETIKKMTLETGQNYRTSQINVVILSDE